MLITNVGIYTNSFATEDRWRISSTSSTYDTGIVFEKNGKQVEFSHAKRLIVNLIGNSGSGKSTQGKMLASSYGIPHFSLGDIYREALVSQSPLGSLIQYQFNMGAMYTINELCLGILANRFAQPDCSNGFILDGFPRTQIQGTVLNSVFLHPCDVHIPIFLDVSNDIILARLVHRWYCKSCNLQVREHDEIQKKGECPTCNRPLIKREDDQTTAKIKERLRAFSEYREGILSSIQERDPIHILIHDDNIGPKEIFERICVIVDHVLDMQSSKKLPSPTIRRASIMNRESI